MKPPLKKACYYCKRWVWPWDGDDEILSLGPMRPAPTLVRVCSSNKECRRKHAEHEERMRDEFRKSREPLAPCQFNKVPHTWKEHQKCLKENPSLDAYL